MSVNRETVRDGVVAVFGAMVTAGTVQAVVGHRISDPQGQTPIVSVLSNGTQRVAMTMQGSRAVFGLLAQVLVLAEEATGYTAADAEDKLDLVEKSLADLVDANRKTALWDDLRQGEQMSEILDVSIGGHAYLLETIPLVVKVSR